MKINILMATYNGEKYIREQIESILSQSFKNWFLTISDDFSTDQTINIINEYANKYPDKIRLIKKDRNSGSAKKNFFYLINNCEYADYYMFSDQDDIWLPEKIEKTLSKMEENDENCPIAVYTDLIVVDKNLSIISKSFLDYTNIPTYLTFEENLIQNNITGCTLMINNKMRRELQKIKNIDNCIMHDWVISLIGNSFGKLIYSNSTEILYRQHDNNSVGATPSNFTLEKIFSMKLFLNYRIIENNTINQAKEFISSYQNEINFHQGEVLNAYINIRKQNKIKRLEIYHKYKIIKKGYFRKLKQILLG